MLTIDDALRPRDLLPAIERMWELSATKIAATESSWDAARGAPVFTVDGRWTSRGWTEWTQGFQYGSALLQFDATGDERFLTMGREGTRQRMASHVTHVGVHDHGFNNVSTYGTLWRLMQEGRIQDEAGERAWLELALRASGAVQARRWTRIPGGGFVYSFNGPHSLFVDTIRSLRALALGHVLGQVLMEERDNCVSLLERLILHAHATARFNVFDGTGRDIYDVRGRTAHEAIFDTIDGSYRCPSSQQGYSPFTTWTRGLAWAMTGFAEELEWLATLDDTELEPFGGRAAVEAPMLAAAQSTSDFYIEHVTPDGIPFWDTGAPGLAAAPDALDIASDPWNAPEPVDSSAAAIAVQGLVRLGSYLTRAGRKEDGRRYRQAGLTVLRTLLDEPYLASDPLHQGLLLHSVYHRPNGWDHVPPGRAIPCGEASMWGDYHLREAGLLVQREARGEPYLAFFGPVRVKVAQ